MKKQRKLLTPMFLLLLLTVMQYGCVGIGVTSRSHNNTIEPGIQNQKIIGTWLECKQDSTVNTNRYNKGFVMYKIISDKSFINVDIKKRKNYNTIYGSYELRDGIYTEFVESTSSGFKHVLGEKNSFKVKFVGDLMILDGLNNNYNSIWKRLK